MKHFFLRHTKPEIINPYLVAYTPLLALYTSNAAEVYLFDVVRPVIVIFVCISLVRIVLYRLIGDTNKVSLILTTSLFLSFVAGHLVRLLPYFELIKLPQFSFSRNPLLLLTTCIVIILTARYFLKTKRSFKPLQKQISLTLLLVMFINTVRIGITLGHLSEQKKVVPLSSRVLSTNNLAELPDIYYIILDGHARVDVLTTLYDVKQNDLIKFLEKNHFYIGTQSKSNYVYTHLSIATALNYDYVENLTQVFIQGQKNSQLLTNFIENNKAARRLKSLGYSYVLFNSGWHATEKSSLADITYEYEHSFNNFELAFLRTNIFARLLNLIPNDPRTMHRDRVLYEFERLAQLPLDPRPTFTFAHILSPHPPFVFNEQGSEYDKGGRFTLADGFGSVHTKEEYKNGYRGQVLYIDTLLIKTLSTILKNSPVPPIIIIQSDHGPASEIAWENNSGEFLTDVIDANNPTSVYERTSILNAYYFPYGGNEKLYSSISPVNSFRLLFNYYFGGDFPILEDKTFIDR